jgi:hypothetical protein
MRLPLRSALRVLLLGALAALSLPGVHAARAESDLLPPAKQMFAFDAKQPARAAPSSQSCGASPAATLQRADIGHQAAMAQLAKIMGAGDGEVLNGRGYNYRVNRDPAVEIMRIQQEARGLAIGRRN